MKRYRISLIYILAIAIISLLYLHPILSFRFYESHDGEAHAARFAAYHRAFVDGHFPPRWAGFLNFGYGTPVFIFYYPLPGYIAGILRFTGISFESIFILLMICAFTLAPIFFFLWLRQLFKNSTAFIGALLFGLMPYHFLNTYVRGDIAENMALVFVPLVFYFIERYRKTKLWKHILFGGISYGLLILSHNGVSLMFSPVLFFYALLRADNRKLFLNLIVIFVFGLALSAFFWLPALYEGKYTNANLFIGDMYLQNYPSWKQLIFSPWGFGTDVQKPGSLSVQVGIVNLILVVLAILNVKKNRFKRMAGYWFFIFVCSMFISLGASAPIWENVSILRLYEFPWRFVLLISFSAILVGITVLNSLNKIWLNFFVIFFLLLYSFQFVTVKKYVSFPNTFYENFSGTTYYHGEANPIWTDGDPGSYPKQLVEVIGGDAKLKKINKKSHRISFVSQSNEKSQILINTQYFPGWAVEVGGVKIPIEFQDMNHRGLITFYLPPGSHNVKLEFRESPVRLVSSLISVAAIIVVLSLLIWQYRKKLIFVK